MTQPPRIWQAVLRLIVHHSEQQFVEGDLEETFHEIEDAYDVRRARQWYRSQVLRSIPGFLLRTSYWSWEMTKNYLLLALRNIRKSLGFVTINVSGLAIGLACTIMIGLFTISELSFDRHHENAERIVRIVRTSKFTEIESRDPVTPAPLGPMLQANFPEVEDYFRLWKRGNEVELRTGTLTWMQSGVYDADASILDILTVPSAGPWVDRPLEQAFHLMLSESTARRLFGTGDVVGRTLKVQGEDYVVDGVYADFPATSHFRPAVLLSFETLVQQRPGLVGHLGNNLFHTYLLLAPGIAKEAVDAKIPGAIEAVAGPEVAARLGFYMQPLLDIHLHSHMERELEINGSVETLYVLGLIALFILVLAVVNFINLSTARSARRAREVGVRKAVGAYRNQVVSQFLGETIVLSFLSLVLSLLVVVGFAPVFSELSGRALDLMLLTRPLVVVGLLVFVTVVGLVAGAYPALVLARFNPVQVLKGTAVTPGSAGSPLFRRGLVVFQFVVSIILIVGTLIVDRQLTYLRSQPLGFNQEQMLVTRLRTPEMHRHGERLQTEFERVSGVSAVTGSSNLLGNGAGGVLIMPEGVEKGVDGITLALMLVESNFIDVMDVDLMAGRSFDPDRPLDIEDAFVINVQAAERMGWTPEEAIGKNILWPSGLDGSSPPVRDGVVIGVIDDFHFTSLHSAVEPLMLIPADATPTYLMSRIGTGNVFGTMKDLEEAWGRVFPEDAFESFFLDAHFDSLYASEERSSRLFRVFSFLAIALAGLGLLGLASHTTSRRVREIGIRKVMGASSAGILRMLLTEFVGLVAVSFVLAAPLAWYIMQGWLANFPYRVGTDPAVYVAAALAVLVLTAVTVGYHALRAAWSDPVDAIRNE